MKIHEYNQMMNYLTRPEPQSLPLVSNVERQGFSPGGIVGDREKLIKLIEDSNKGFKVESFKDLAFKAGYAPYRREASINLPIKLDSSKDKVTKAFEYFTSDLNKPVEEFMDLPKKISDLTGVKGTYISTLLQDNENFKELKPALTYLASPASRAKVMGTGRLFSDIVNRYEQAPGKQLAIGYLSPERKIMEYARRHVLLGGDKIKFIKPIDEYGFGEAEFTYKGKKYDIDKLRYEGRKDKNFKELYKVYDEREKLLNKEVTHPITKEKVTFNQLMQEAYEKGAGYKKTDIYDIDHIKGIEKDPFNNLRILTARTNQGAGALRSLESQAEKGVLKNTAKYYSPENVSKQLNKIGYNYTKSIDKLAEDEVKLAEDILLKERKLRTPQAIAKEKIVELAKEPSLATRMSNQVAFGPSGIMEVGEEVIKDVKGIYGKYAPQIAKGTLTGLQVLGTPAVATGFYAADVASDLKQAADEGNLTAKKALDAFVGQGEKGLYFLLPELAKDVVTSPIANKILQLGKIGRFSTPVGIGLSAAGVAKDFYDQYKEFQALSPEEKEKRIKESTYTPTEQDFLQMQEAESRASAAKGGRIGFADGSDEIQIPTLTKKPKSSIYGKYASQIASGKPLEKKSKQKGKLGPEDPLSKYESYSEEELLGNIEAKRPNQIQSFSLEEYQLNTMPMFEPKDVAPPKSYSPMQVLPGLNAPGFAPPVDLKEGGPSDPSKRKFIKGAGIVGAVGLASKFIPDLFQAAKKGTKVVPKKAPFVNIVKPLGATETQFPEWFPTLISRLRKEGNMEPIYRKETIPITADEYVEGIKKGEKNIYANPRTEEYFKKNPGEFPYFKTKETEDIIGYKYTDKNLPDVKVLEFEGKEANVYFKNNYGREVEINYRAPGTTKDAKGNVVKEEGSFSVRDYQPEAGSYPDSGPDFEEVFVSDLEEVLGGVGKVEQYATKAKTTRYTKGEAAADEAEGRAQAEIDRMKDEGLFDE